MKNLVQEKEKIKQELMDKLAVIKNVQLRIALYIDLIDSLDSYAQSVCAEKVSAVRQEIYNAWNVEGRMPTYHRKMQAKLRQEWPVLAKALEQLQQSSDEFEPLQSQVDRLANFILENIPGEPSQDEGAIDCAIRLLRKAYIENKSSGDEPNLMPPKREYTIKAKVLDVEEDKSSDGNFDRTKLFIPIKKGSKEGNI